MRVRHGWTVGLTCLLVLVGPARAHSQHRGVVGGEGQVSPTTLVTYWARTDRGDGSTPEILLLVLCRGRPGWIGTQFIGSSAPFDARQADLRAARRHLLEARYQIGHERLEVTLTVSFDPQAKTVEILGEKHALGDHNVVLVDSVDTRAHVMRTLRVDPALIMERDFMPAEFSQQRRIIDIRKVLQRSRELLEFTRE